MTEIVIQKNIPIPGKLPKTKYPWLEMKIGDSFWVKENRNRILTAANQYCKRNGIKFKWKSRREKNGTRIWRIK